MAMDPEPVRPLEQPVQEAMPRPRPSQLLTEVPRPKGMPPSEKQLSYLRSLAAHRGLDPQEVLAGVESMKEASMAIEILLKSTSASGSSTG